MPYTTQEKYTAMDSAGLRTRKPQRAHESLGGIHPGGSRSRRGTIIACVHNHGREKGENGRMR